MADNVQVSDNPVVAADVIGGVAYQRVKVNWGANDTANDVSAANPLPVTTIDAAGSFIRDDALSTLAVSEGQKDSGRVDSVGRIYTAASIQDSAGAILPFPAPIYPTSTPTLSTTPAYSAGDTLTTSALTFSNAVFTSDSTGWITALTIIDDDDGTHDGTNGQMYIHFFSGSVTPGTANAAFALASDAESAKYLGTIDTSDGVWYDMGPTKVITVFPPRGPIPIRCVGSTTLYAAVVAKSTFAAVVTASGMDFIPHIVRD